MPRQYLLNRAVWDSNEVRDRLQTYVREMIAGTAGMLVIDAHRLSQKGEEIGGSPTTRQWDRRTP
jgi:SRSO17 transposase